MAQLKAGNVSGYASHGPERRGDARSPHHGTVAGGAMVRVPFRPVTPLGDPSKLDLGAEARGLGRAVRRGARVSRAIQQAQQPPGNGMTWTASPVPGRPGGPAPAPPGGTGAPAAPGHGAPAAPGHGWTWTAAAGPAYGGAAYNSGGGPLANAMSGPGSSGSPELPPGPGMPYNRGWAPHARQGQPAASPPVIQGTVVRSRPAITGGP